VSCKCRQEIFVATEAVTAPISANAEAEHHPVPQGPCKTAAILFSIDMTTRDSKSVMAPAWQDEPEAEAPDHGQLEILAPNDDPVSDPNQRSDAWRWSGKHIALGRPHTSTDSKAFQPGQNIDSRSTQPWKPGQARATRVTRLPHSSLQIGRLSASLVD
jgi:hypothetical protein